MELQKYQGKYRCLKYIYLLETNPDKLPMMSRSRFTKGGASAGALESKSGDLIECSICYEYFEEEGGVMLSCCGLVLCDECLKRYVLNSNDITKHGYLCMSFDCRKSMNTSSLTRDYISKLTILTDKERKKILRLIDLKDPKKKAKLDAEEITKKRE